MTDDVTSYSEFVAQQTRPPGAPARYYEILFQTLYIVLANEAALPAFKASLTPLEQQDLAWWQDQILVQFERYHTFRATMMAEAAAADEETAEQTTEESSQEVLRRMAGELKRLWQAVAADLEAVYTLAGRPQGPGTAAMQSWAAEQATLRRAAREAAWQEFIQGLGEVVALPAPAAEEFSATDEPHDVGADLVETPPFFLDPAVESQADPSMDSAADYEAPPPEE